MATKNKPADPLNPTPIEPEAGAAPQIPTQDAPGSSAGDDDFEPPKPPTAAELKKEEAEVVVPSSHEFKRSRKYRLLEDFKGSYRTHDLRYAKGRILDEAHVSPDLIKSIEAAGAKLEQVE